jgi:tetrahydromethanopterin S-methyltransferase subunit G
VRNNLAKVTANEVAEIRRDLDELKRKLENTADKLENTITYKQIITYVMRQLCT